MVGNVKVSRHGTSEDLFCAFLCVSMVVVQKISYSLVAIIISFLLLPLALFANNPDEPYSADVNETTELMKKGRGRGGYKRNPYNNRLIIHKKGVNRRGKGINHRARKYPDNFIAASVSGGYSNMFTYDKVAQPIGLAGATFGFGYEMHARNENFWWSVMGEIEYLTSSLAINNEAGDRWIHDNENYLAVIHYDINRWRDYQQYLFASVPVMLGYRDKRFYVGAGPKFMFCTMGHATNSLNYTTYATYDRYCDDFVDMPNHYYTNYTSTGSSKLKFNSFNLALCFEIGSTIFDQTYDVVNPKEKKKHSFNPRLIMKLGFYAEYGFLNLNNSSGGGNIVTVRADEAHTLDVIPLFTSGSMTNNTVNPFYAGVKLTILYTHHCRNCHGKAKVF